MTAPTSVNIDCPQCGASKTFYPVRQPRISRPPFRQCRTCRHTAPLDSDDLYDLPELRTLAPEQQLQAQKGYGAAAAWCAEQLWTPHPDFTIETQRQQALHFLRKRGFTDELIKARNYGFHPNVWKSDEGVGRALGNADSSAGSAYVGGYLGGIYGPQGQPKYFIRGVITIPYSKEGVTTLLRTRKLDPGDGPKYFVPGGITMFAGATPTLYNADLLGKTQKLILTEGEFKADLVCQRWEEGKLSMPAAAQPGISYMPEDYLDALAGKCVYLVYDSEKRKNAFVPSPGEAYTIRAGEAMTGLGLQRQITKLEYRFKKSKDDDEKGDIMGQLASLRPQLAAVKARGITVFVVRLPRAVDQAKVDIDGFLLAGNPDEQAAAFQQLIDKATPFAQWYGQHGWSDYRYEPTGMFNGQQVANYQAVLTENITLDDGVEKQTRHRFIVKTPSGAQQQIEIDWGDWADDKKALAALRKALHDGTARDDRRFALDAVKSLSLVGDGPAQRLIPTATGWHQINGKWHYLMPDGSITADGIDRSQICHVPENAAGNHYAMCGPGDAQNGARAVRMLMDGLASDQAEAMVLLGQAALALLHRYMNDDGRALVWLDGETGAMKTSLVRTILSLFGPRFTAERGDGAPVPKWDSTAVGLELLAFTYRDTLLLVDDYKQATAQKGMLAKFIHSYSEGSPRNRGNADLTLRRTYPARCIAICTGEDRPTGDTGQLARLLLYPHLQGTVNPDALSDIQRAGRAGDMAAFWRGFVQALASELDTLGPEGMEKRLGDLRRADDERLPGHARTAGTFRQNRAAFLVLTTWMQKAGYITEADAERYSQAHLSARRQMLAVQQSAMAEERPANIYIRVIQEMLAGKEVRITDDQKIEEEESIIGITRTQGMDDGLKPDYKTLNDLKAGMEIGFWWVDKRTGKRYAAIYPEKSFEFVQKRRTWQRQPIEYSRSAIGQQLLADGAISKHAKHRSESLVWRGDSRIWVWLIDEDVFVGGTDNDSGEPESPESGPTAPERSSDHQGSSISKKSLMIKKSAPGADEIAKSSDHQENHPLNAFSDSGDVFEKTSIPHVNLDDLMIFDDRSPFFGPPPRESAPPAAPEPPAAAPDRPPGPAPLGEHARRLQMDGSVVVIPPAWKVPTEGDVYEMEFSALDFAHAGQHLNAKRICDHLATCDPALAAILRSELGRIKRKHQEEARRE